MADRKMGMVEKVARAICQATGWDPDQQVPTTHAIAARNYLYSAWEDYTAEARAAIIALSEPTQAMYDHQTYQAGSWSHRNVEAFIDAALSETPEPTTSASQEP